jgi:hypothetical protein
LLSPLSLIHWAKHITRDAIGGDRR